MRGTGTKARGTHTTRSVAVSEREQATTRETRMATSETTAGELDLASDQPASGSSLCVHDTTNSGARSGSGNGG